MEQKTITVYSETWTMHIFLPEYVNECSVKQLRKFVKEMVKTEYDNHKLESHLCDMLEAARFCCTVAQTNSRQDRLKKKVRLLADAINTYTDRIEEYDK